MINFHVDTFLQRYHGLKGNLSDMQEKGLRFLCDKLIRSSRIDTVPKGSYVLATTAHETGYTFQPIKEWGSLEYLTKKLYYPYFGRGYCQLTWKENYIKFGEALTELLGVKVNLELHPDLALDREIAWLILEMGMTNNFGVKDPDFTKYTLEDFLTSTKNDYYNCRKIINPADKKTFQPIANIARHFQILIEASIIGEDDIAA